MSNQSTNQPLVSVCIVTYNSADFIIEALDSVAAQTYKNIELIVSDDCSKDNTVEICQEWLTRNKDRFVNTELLTVEKNTGVSANCNRAIRKSKGEWIKYFAGDDKLLPNCINDNVEYLNKHPETDILFSSMLSFGTDEANMIISRAIYFKYLSKYEFKLHLLVTNFLPAPSSFFRKALYDRVNGFDETIPMMEDKPFYIKCLYAGCVFSYHDNPTVCYRIGNQSISQNRPGNRYTESQKMVFERILELLYKENKLLWLYRKTEYSYRYYSSFSTRFLRALRFLNPYYYYIQYIFFKMRIINHSIG